MTTPQSSARARTGAELEDRTLTFATDIVSFVAALPRTEVNGAITRQLVRSGTSVGANYREANRAESRTDFAHKVAIAVKEAPETEYWPLLCDRCGFGNPAQRLKLLGESNELIAILTTILRGARRQ